MANKIADIGWDDMPVIQYLMKHGGDIQQDNDGQIVIYTGLYETDKGELVEPDEDEFDANGNLIDGVLSQSDNTDDEETNNDADEDDAA